MHTIRKLWVVCWAVFALVAVVDGGLALAQEKPASPPAQGVKDARALDILKRMSDTLAQAKTLSFTMRGLVPFTGPTGQYISMFASSHVVMQRPDKLFVESRGDLFPSDLYFDGKTVTTIALDKQFYSQKAAAGSSVDALMGAEHPGADVLALCADMIVSDPYAGLTKDMASALLVGQSTIAGVKADHLAFTGKGLDWEIWVGAQDKLPVLMVVSYREGERQPTFTVEFSGWKRNAPTPARTFNAVIPKTALQLEFKPQALSQSK